MEMVKTSHIYADIMSVEWTKPLFQPLPRIEVASQKHAVVLSVMAKKQQ